MPPTPAARETAETARDESAAEMAAAETRHAETLLLKAKPEPPPKHPHIPKHEPLT